ncbi:hypothetical protein INS49_000727 [Diaporthe citri]|uniref:uncharacterized protein n=1 Tax=Diaporthe citri TaxID=83186 RepID=UPI001C80A9EB|nr:uncharacterized protein INS49_000727 [Diaporthe citri]KAG6366549.1 hypothetical protein INS49_000727 [Diaporthe citri]
MANQRVANKRIELEALLVEVENPNFVPCPKISLSVDAKKLGQCGICQESQLLLRSEKRGLDDSTLAILPCGHVAGYKCLRNWFSLNESPACPFCRTPLRYQLCNHTSRLIRPLTRENLLSTPDTLPVGGVVPPQCVECSVATNASVNKYLLDAMLDKFKALRTEYHEETDARKKLEVKLQVLTCKKRIDKAIEELAAYPTLARTRWPVATRVFENLKKYVPVVKLLGEKHQEFSRTIDLVKLAVNGLANYYGLFIFDQHQKLINAVRLEDDYSRNVTLIGRDLKTWARNPDLTLRGKIGLTRLYSVLERCLRDALELYAESERELIREDIKVHMSQNDAYEGQTARSYIANLVLQPHPAGFDNFRFTRHDWREPDEDSIRVLTGEEQTQLKNFISRPDVQRLLPSNLRNPNIDLPPVEDDNSGDRDNPGPSKKIGPLTRPKSKYLKRKKGILKDPNEPRDRPKKNPNAAPDFSPDSSGTPSNSSDDEHTSASSTSSRSDKSEGRPLARTPVKVDREVAVSVRAYLGRRHDEYGLALAADPDTDFVEDEDVTEAGDEDDNTEAGDDAEDVPHDDEACAAHLQLSHTARQNTAHDVSGTALLHWAGVAKAKREERIEGHTRLRAILKWAEREGKVPLSPSSIRATTGLRRGIFTPLGLPDLPPPRRRSRRPFDPEAYRDAALENLEHLRPRRELTLLAFLYNEDALRLFGGLVGEQPLPSDLGRMDKVLRELEVYTEVCAHRRRLMVDHLKRTRQFPIAMAAQFGDLRAALQDAEEAKLSAARRCFEYVAERSRYVMAYPGGKRRRREFAGQFRARDRERLEYLSGEDDEAGALREELEAAEEWLGWCEDVMGEWALGWRPGRVEKDMLYVDEEAQADVRRYKWEINQKRSDIGLVPVKRPQDEVYERQQEHIRLLDGLWKLMT